MKTSAPAGGQVFRHAGLLIGRDLRVDASAGLWATLTGIIEPVLFLLVLLTARRGPGDGAIWWAQGLAAATLCNAVFAVTLLGTFHKARYQNLIKLYALTSATPAAIVASLVGAGIVRGLIYAGGFALAAWLLIGTAAMPNMWGMLMLTVAGGAALGVGGVAIAARLRTTQQITLCRLAMLPALLCSRAIVPRGTGGVFVDTIAAVSPYSYAADLARADSLTSCAVAFA